MFCPECGTKCIAAVDKFYACYDCPECLVHWSYVDGQYSTASYECFVCEAEEGKQDAKV